MKLRLLSLAPWASLLLIQDTWADTTAVPAAPAGASIVQMLLGLAVVLALLWGSLYLLKRLQASRLSGQSQVKVLGGAAVGPRERVVLVEVADTWLVLGVAPGRVNALHHLPRQVLAEAEPVPDRDFATWLKRTLERRHEGS